MSLVIFNLQTYLEHLRNEDDNMNDFIKLYVNKRIQTGQRIR